MPHGVSRIEELSVTDIRHKPSLVILTHLVGDRVKGVASLPPRSVHLLGSGPQIGHCPPFPRASHRQGVSMQCFKGSFLSYSLLPTVL